MTYLRSVIASVFQSWYMYSRPSYFAAARRPEPSTWASSFQRLVAFVVAMASKPHSCA